MTKAFSGNRPSLEDVRESAMEMDKISARKRQSLEPRGGICQDSATEHGRRGLNGKEEELAEAEAEIASERDARHKKGPHVRPLPEIAKKWVGCSPNLLNAYECHASGRAL